MTDLGTVKVGNLTFTIREATIRERRCLGDRYGQFDEKKGEILLRKGLTPEVRLDTLAHEIVHALFFVSGAGHYLSELVGDKSEQVEEMLIRMVLPLALSMTGKVSL